MSTPVWLTSRRRIRGYVQHDTYRERWEPQLVNASFEALTPWSTRLLFVQDMMGEHYGPGAQPVQNTVAVAVCGGGSSLWPNQLGVSLAGSGFDGDYLFVYNQGSGQWEYNNTVGGFSGMYISPSGALGFTFGFLGGGGGAATAQQVNYDCVQNTVSLSGLQLAPFGGNNNATVMGGSSAGGGFRAGGNIQRNPPQTFPSYSKLYCVGCEIVKVLGVPSNDGSNFITYLSKNPSDPDQLQQDAGPVYRCTFSALPYDVKTDSEVAASPEGELIRYVVRKPKQVGEQIQSIGAFKFRTAPQDPLPTPPAIQAPYRQIVYEWCLVPDPIFNVLETADGLYAKVNDRVFDQSYGAYAPGTLLFLGGEYERVPLTPGLNTVWNIRFNFAYRAQGWNRAYRPNWAGSGLLRGLVPGAGAPEFPDWDDVLNVITGRAPYGAKNFYTLFKL